MNRCLRLSVQIASAAALTALAATPAVAQGSPPQATLQSVTPESSTILQANGSVSTNGSDTSFVIQYGTSLSLAQSTQRTDIGGCGGCGPAPIEQPVVGLSPDTHYYLRIAATNADGTAYSQTLSAWTQQSNGTPGGPSPGPSSSTFAKDELAATMLRDHGVPSAGLAGVSCPSESFCIAVGGGTTSSVIERWNGQRWRSSVLRGGSLSAVSCLSESFCMAVGRTGEPTSRVLAERFNGRSWSRVSAASPSLSGNGDALNGVDCLSRSDCWGVGGMHLGEGGLRNTLVEHWNGRSFGVVAVPDYGNALLSIGCARAGDCWAIGYSRGAAFSGNQVEHLAGRAWRLGRLPVELTSGTGAVSCRSPGTCWIAGASGGRPAVVRLVTGSWRRVAVPSLQKPGGAALTGIDCFSNADCWAVGDFYGPGFRPTEAPFAEQWDGSAWKIAKVAGRPGRNSSFSSVSCGSASRCVAVGSSGLGRSPMVAISRPLH